jgi:hypothetical protein
LSPKVVRRLARRAPPGPTRKVGDERRPRGKGDPLRTEVRPQPGILPETGKNQDSKGCSLIAILEFPGNREESRARWVPGRSRSWNFPESGKNRDSDGCACVAVSIFPGSSGKRATVANRGAPASETLPMTGLGPRVEVWSPSAHMADAEPDPLGSGDRVAAVQGDLCGNPGSRKRLASGDRSRARRRSPRAEAPRRG